jgi:hypothetical protein
VGAMPLDVGSGMQLTTEGRLRFHNPFLDLYMETVENTESPRVFHVFSALAGIAACLGRRNYLPFGTGVKFPNMFVALVGPPAVRKNTAINITAGAIRSATGVRFAPDDTGGKRQGLIRALENKKDPEIEKMEKDIDIATTGNLDNLSNAPFTVPDSRDNHVLFICASEMNSFMGTQNKDMLPFMTKCYDGDPYTYQLKDTQQELPDPLLTMLAGTTPQSIADAMPPEAVGQGLMSRMLLIYHNKKYKDIPWPEPLPQHLFAQIENTYGFLHHDFDGEFSPSTPAKRLLTSLYAEQAQISDSRFTHYCGRRFDHLLKISMCLAAARRTHIIETGDVEEANTILKAAEGAMPDALGEYGMSKLSMAKQRIVEFLQQAKQPIPETMVAAMMARDMSGMEFRNSMMDLCNAGKIVQVKISGGTGYVYKDRAIESLAELLDGLGDFSEGEPAK